jgi:uncharacterized membrane protein YkoI
MMKVTFSIALVGVMTACGASSSSGSGAGEEITEASAKDKATEIVPGSATSAHQLDEEDRRLWEVHVDLNRTGREVKVELHRADGTLYETGGEDAPFDYDLAAPIPGMLSLAQARAKAAEAKPGSNIELWEFHVDDKQYELYARDTDNKLWEIKLAGDTGSLISALQKDKAD